MEHNTLGNNIKQLRKQKGLTQVDLADKLGCTQGIITAYENDLKRPSVEKITQLSEILGVSSDELLGLKDIRTTTPSKSPKLWKKFEQLQSLPSDDKRMVFKMIDGLIAQRQ
jgi:transcriptional regulator with XRE-family HTH domain